MPPNYLTTELIDWYSGYFGDNGQAPNEQKSGRGELLTTRSTEAPLNVMFKPVFFFSMNMKVLIFCHKSQHLGKQLSSPREEVFQHRERSSSLKAKPFQMGFGAREDLQPQATPIFSVKRALLRGGVDSFRRSLTQLYNTNFPLLLMSLQMPGVLMSLHWLINLVQ